MLANTSLFCEMPIRMNLDDKDWISLAKGYFDTHKKSKLPIISNFLLNAPATKLDLPWLY